MEKALNVVVIDVTGNALDLIYSACRQCYSVEFAGRLIKEGFRSDNTQREAFVRQIVSSGHESPLEHVKFTFAIEGVSRALTHQLVRHRIASYSQQSQRYVKHVDFDYIMPPAIAADDEMRKEFVSTMERIQAGYDSLLKLFQKKGCAGECANQDARFVLPQAVETKIVVTMNCRELTHFFRERCCVRAQWEIRRLAEEMLAICKRELSPVFADAGAKCEALGYCPEGEKFSCGKYPLKREFFGGDHATDR